MSVKGTGREKKFPNGNTDHNKNLALEQTFPFSVYRDFKYVAGVLYEILGKLSSFIDSHF